MGDHCECGVEVSNGGSWGSTLVLVNPMLEGITNVEGESTGDLEGDVDGLAEDASNQGAAGGCARGWGQG